MFKALLDKGREDWNLPVGRHEESVANFHLRSECLSERYLGCRSERRSREWEHKAICSPNRHSWIADARGKFEVNQGEGELVVCEVREVGGWADLSPAWLT